MEGDRFLVITNAGEVCPEALTLLGASSKQGDSTKIGFFGSGNKYALAALLRTGHKVTIYAGAKEITIEARPTSFRGESFELIYVDGEKTSITTRTGPEWTVWMAIREFLSNAKDEGGDEWHVSDCIRPAIPGTTSIYVSYSREIELVMDNLGKYINEDTPIESVKTQYGTVDILEGEDGVCFRKSIRCVDPDRDGQSLFRYNFEKIAINESRIAEYYAIGEHLSFALKLTMDEGVIRKIITHLAANETSDLLEDRVTWNSSYQQTKLSPAWERVLLATGQVLVSHEMASILPADDAAQMLCLPLDLIKKISKDYPNIPMHGDMDNSSVPASPSRALRSQVAAAVKELKSLGEWVPLPILYCSFVDEGSLACITKGNIYLSVDRKIEDMTAAILEELEHHKTGFSDGTRALQTHLFTRLLAAKREQLPMRNSLKAIRAALNAKE